MNDSEIIAIDQAIQAQGKSRADLGRLLGLDSSQVSRIFAGRRRLQRHEHAEIVAWLGGDLGGAPAGALVALPGLIPLYGWFPAGDGAQLQIGASHLRGYVPPHPGQAHIKDCFALTVDGDAMSPRYDAGEIVYLAPHRWPAKGGDGLALLTNGRAIIARFVGREGGEIILATLNPPTAHRLALAEVAAIHAIVGRD